MQTELIKCGTRETQAGMGVSQHYAKNPSGDFNKKLTVHLFSGLRFGRRRKWILIRLRVRFGGHEV